MTDTSKDMLIDMLKMQVEMQLNESEMLRAERKQLRQALKDVVKVTLRHSDGPFIERALDALGVPEDAEPEDVERILKEKE